MLKKIPPFKRLEGLSQGGLGERGRERERAGAGERIKEGETERDEE